MNKYQEALHSIYFTFHQRVKPKYLSVCEDENLKIIEELVYEKTEQESRKDKLIVGSEWECVADCITEHYTEDDVVSSRIFKNTLVNVSLILNGVVDLKVKKYGGLRSVMTDQFLLCFKPKGEKE